MVDTCVITKDKRLKYYIYGEEQSTVHELQARLAEFAAKTDGFTTHFKKKTLHT